MSNSREKELEKIKEIAEKNGDKEIIIEIKKRLEKGKTVNK